MSDYHDRQLIESVKEIIEAQIEEFDFSDIINDYTDQRDSKVRDLVAEEMQDFIVRLEEVEENTSPVNKELTDKVDDIQNQAFEIQVSKIPTIDEAINQIIGRMDQIESKVQTNSATIVMNSKSLTTTTDERIKRDNQLHRSIIGLQIRLSQLSENLISTAKELGND